MRDIVICTANNRQAARWPAGIVRFDELYDRLKTPYRTMETMAEYMAMPKAERDEVKDKGGFVAGMLKDGRRRKDAVEYRSMIVLDADKLKPEVLKCLGAHIKYKAIFYTTHSHTAENPRGRIIIPLTRDVTPEEAVAMSRYLCAEIGMDMFDACSFEVNQLMYWPTCSMDGEYICELIEGEVLDPDLFLADKPWKDPTKLPRASSEEKSVQHERKKQQDPRTKDGVIGAFCRAYDIQSAIDKFLPDVYEPSAVEGRYSYIPGEGSAGVVFYDDVFAYSFHATDPAGHRLLNAFDIVRIHKFGDEKNTINEMSRFAAEDENTRVQMQHDRQDMARKDFDPEDDEGWKKRLLYEKGSNVLKNSFLNLQLILENDKQLKGIVFNEQSDSLEIKGSVPWSHPSKHWRDADDAQLIAYVEACYGTFSDRNYKYALAKVADDRRYHPIREYFRSLPGWDGIPRVDTLLIDYFGAEDNAYVRAVTRKTLCGAVNRVLHPGCKFDTMLVLNGSQGIGKSTLIAKLGGEWFSDSLSLTDTRDNKTAAEKLQGYWILEIGELAGLRKAEEETLRGFITRQNDIYRAAFGRRPVPHLRQCIFIGTTNAENGYLRDTTGNRRFWPVKTPGGGSKRSWDLTNEEVVQIWAETMVYVNAGERLYLLPEEELLAKTEQREAMESDEREGLVRDYLDTLLPDNWDAMDIYERRNYLSGDSLTSQEGRNRRQRVCTLEIWCECFGRDRSTLTRADSNRLVGILIRMGWERQEFKERVKPYGPQYCFVPKFCSREQNREHKF